MKAYLSFDKFSQNLRMGKFPEMEKDFGDLEQLSDDELFERFIAAQHESLKALYLREIEEIRTYTFKEVRQRLGIERGDPFISYIRMIYRGLTKEMLLYYYYYQDKITLAHARPIAKMQTTMMKIQSLEEVVRGKASQKKLYHRLQDITDVSKDVDIKRLETSASDQLGLPVKIKQVMRRKLNGEYVKSKGRLEITYYDLEKLEELLNLLDIDTSGEFDGNSTFVDDVYESF